MGRPVEAFEEDLTITKESPRETHLLAIRPADGAINIEPAVEIHLTFEQPINPLSLSSESVRLTQYGSSVDVSFSLANKGREVILAPKTLLKEGGRVRLVISGIEDLAGILITPFSLEFDVGNAKALPTRALARTKRR